MIICFRNLDKDNFFKRRNVFVNMFLDNIIFIGKEIEIFFLKLLVRLGC